MSSYIEKDISCKCCGHNYRARILKGLTTQGPTGLDMDPHNYMVCDRIAVCPECGYATAKLNKEVDDSIKTAVGSREYQELRASSEDRRAVKALMAAKVAEAEGNYHEASTDYLMAYWVLRYTGSPLAQRIRLKAAEMLDRYLDDEQDVDSAMIYIDLHRQAGNFEEAQETLEWLVDYIEEGSFLADIAAFEKELIAGRNAAPHLVSEVR